jgi:pyruvate,orthophosphate dikinase
VSDTAPSLAALVAAALDPADPTTPATAVAAVEPATVEHELHARVDDDSNLVDLDLLATGLAASPGVASGVAAFDVWRALDMADEGQDVVLVRPETSPADEPALVVAVGVVTSRGGMSSHAAVVARGRGLPAVCGADSLRILDDSLTSADGTVVREGEPITVDGSAGEVRLGRLRTTRREMSTELETLLVWADELRAGRLAVRANADTADDARRALALGADGIGLCRTEHQFLGERLPLLQSVILTEDLDVEARGLAALEVAQRDEFVELLEVMDGRPVAVRLLDPPLHEFVPDLVELAVADAKGELDEAGRAELIAARRWHEHNPMLGVRGVRLAVLRPALARVQIRALVAAAEARRAAGGDPRPQILVPMVVTPAEVALVRTWVDHEGEAAGPPARGGGGSIVPMAVGAMIETPRAALVAGELAQVADFVSFGTNDLTQMVFGFSRDDVARLLGTYLDQGLLASDPFATLDRVGVGGLVAQAVAAIRAVAPDLPIGVCGEHGGDPASIRTFVELGVGAVSCSPPRLPVARLAAAQALV